MSDTGKEEYMKGGTNSFYCSDEELVRQVNELLDGNTAYRSLSHFVVSCIRNQVEAEGEDSEGGVVNIKIEDKELAEYVETKHTDGEFYSEGHVVTIALTRMKEDDKGDMLV